MKHSKPKEPCANCGKNLQHLSRKTSFVVPGIYCGEICVREAMRGNVPRFARPVAVGALKAGSR